RDIPGAGKCQRPVDDGPRGIQPGCTLQPLEAGAGVHLEQRRALAGLEQIHPGNLQPDDGGRPERRLHIRRLELDRPPPSPAVEVAADLPSLSSPAHRPPPAPPAPPRADPSPGPWKVSRIPGSSGMVDASIPPTPWVPRSSFTTAGRPPTSSTRRRTLVASRAITVRGIRSPERASSCRQRSLSRLLAMAWAPLSAGTPIISSCSTTA